MTKKASVLFARILLIPLGFLCARAIEGWWWLLLIPAAPFFVGFVSSILSGEEDGEEMNSCLSSPPYPCSLWAVVSCQ